MTPDMETMAVASTDYLKRHGIPKTPADLHNHACLNWRYPGSGAAYRWEFEKDKKSFEVSVDGPLISNMQDLVIEGALRVSASLTLMMISAS